MVPKVPAKNCSAAKDTASNKQSLRWEWCMTPILLPSAFGVFAAGLQITNLKTIGRLAPKGTRLDCILRQKSGIFPRIFTSASKICKKRQALNYRIHTHKKSLHSEVDKPVYENSPT